MHLSNGHPHEQHGKPTVDDVFWLKACGVVAAFVVAMSKCSN